MSVFEFEYPYIFIFIFIYTFIVFYFKQKQQSYFIPNIVNHFPSIKRKKEFKNILKHLIVISAIVALASPIKTESIIDKNRHILDIVLNIDTSGSMSLKGLNQQDYNKTRLDVVKNVVKDFINRRQKDKIGLVVFGDKSSVASTLSDDKRAILSIVNKIQIGVVGKSTSLIDSIVQSTNLLKNSFSSSKLIILLSDGDDTASKVPLKIALKIAKKYNIKVYTVSIGESNNNLLNIISKKSSAKSFIATDAKDLKEVYKSITKLEATTHNKKKIKIIHYYYNYVLYFTIFCALLLALLFKQSKDF